MDFLDTKKKGNWFPFGLFYWKIWFVNSLSARFNVPVVSSKQQQKFSWFFDFFLLFFWKCCFYGQLFLHTSFFPSPSLFCIIAILPSHSKVSPSIFPFVSLTRSLVSRCLLDWNRTSHSVADLIRYLIFIRFKEKTRRGYVRKWKRVWLTIRFGKDGLRKAKDRSIIKTWICRGFIFRW